ncbi:lysophospholipid acyltransferase family protein [Croceitalea rosinachiae]|uniref:Lysophospholipid acyltransferase family protein n=1 Tax=Croceitalea rosinachiae TaxID=3075596 RepID=A0ABU3ACZ4_9FLAO|nr:lysophospholipid acyltransferase family protein [Croceitalea sp. F388]MDT0607670.1 lysophospholipid acyltransferase family protein [Croceitalea sp. F388]
MQLLVYLLVYPLLWVISKLPFRLLYLIADGVYYLLYYIIGYRKKVVYNNLALVFPEKTELELINIQKKFYRHLCDMFLEMIKTIGITNSEVSKRYVFTNIELYHRLEKENKNTIIMLPHYASWEWVFSLNAQNNSKGYGIYLKIQNKYFDKLVRDIRSKFGTTLIVTNESRKIIKDAKAKKSLFSVGIISDQSPMLNRARHWAKFMGIMVPVHIGGEELAKQHNLAPLYLKVKKVKRGYYEATFKLLAEDINNTPNYHITDAFLRETEKSIREAPEYYFWTHRRWKHRNDVPTEYKSTAAK